MRNRLFPILTLLLSLCFSGAMASHIVGGEFTYSFLGDTSVSGTVYHKYQLTLSIYEDCLNGQPEAIAQDNPAFFGIYDGVGTRVLVDTGVFFSSSIAVPVNFSNSCVSNIPNTCLLKKTFTRSYLLRPNATGYTVSYQRCCRNSSIMNIIDPGDQGCTYFCTIPASPRVNNSAVFNNYPPQIICLNNPLFYDNSAHDPDAGDSLSYEFCQAYIGASDAVIKPIPLAPPYDTVEFFPPFTYQNPMTGFPPIEINAKTGLITGTPNRLGRFLVTVCCNEWRGGVLINTVKREFQFVVTDCSKVVVADIPQFSTDVNTYIVNCTDYTVDFVNNSKGGFSYQWDFGVLGAINDTSTAITPRFIYPDTGTFTVKLVVNPGSTCPDSIERLVKIYPKFYADFNDSGRQCPGQAVFFTDKSTTTIKPVSYWKWYFGDGDSSLEQNPQHIYKLGGTYNVILISQNAKACIDTSVSQVLVQNFKPYAGDDTIIVKGESILFDAKGGVTYTWSPPDRLNHTDIHDPTGYFADTGLFTYYVHVESLYGCSGDDTIQVRVADHAAFFVPTGFTPNGDGLNDIFRPITIGYRSLRYLRVFDRWGEEVYFGKSLEAGWNGNYKGKKAEMGVYFWELSYIDRFGKEGFMKGDVTLVR